MRCTILAIGSRGDVHPLVAVGLALKAAGADITFATHRDYETEIGQRGFTFRPLEGQALTFYTGAAGNALRERVREPRKFKHLFENYLTLFFERLLRDSWDASRGADVVLSWTGCAPGLAARLGVPVFVTNPYPPPHLPTWAFPNPYQGPYRFRLGPLFNRLTWRRAQPLLQLGERQLNRWRHDLLGLGDTNWRAELQQLRHLPHLLGFSPTILPRPRGWRRSIHVTGTWFLEGDTEYEPPPALRAFLDEGPPPIAIGFSSQVGRDPAALSRLVLESIGEAGLRAVMVMGFGGLKLKDVPAYVLPVISVPYDWLLPRVAALVHQGGAGSTALVCRHGVPSFAVPFGYDQSLWGDRLHALGMGPPPIPAEHLTRSRFARALRAVALTPRFRERAASVSAAMQHERGAENAAAVILASTGQRPPLAIAG